MDDIKILLKRVFKNEAEDDLQDLRIDTLTELSILVSIVGWISAVRAIVAFDQRDNFWLPVLFLCGVVIARRLSRLSIDLSIFALILTVLLAILYESLIHPESPVRLFYVIPVIIASLSIGVWGALASSVLAIGFCMASAAVLTGSALNSAYILTPILLLLSAGFVSQTGARQLNTAFTWVKDSYFQKSSLVEELREERATLARTIKALEEAHIRLEKTNYALIEARSAAEEAKNLKAQFSANISHELRTPLSLIIGFSETMANAPETYGKMKWSPSLRGDVEHIYHASKHLLSMINDILDLSALEVNSLGITLEEVSIHEIFHEAIEVIGDLYHAKGIYLHVEAEPDLPVLRVDRTRIRQVILNLLSNASRFTTQGGVTIRASLEKPFVEIMVQDTGIGIHPSNYAKVFGEFSQVDGDSNRKHEGTGLGIPISKRLVELHGGDFWMESEPGSGTTFFFTLPVSPFAFQQEISQSNDLSKVRNQDYPAYQRSVLVIESDSLLLQIIRRHINNYDIIALSSPDELERLLNLHSPIALLYDCNNSGPFQNLESWMPAISPDLPVLQVALDSPLSVAMLHGVEGYLLKPVERNLLLEKISALDKPVARVLIVDNDPDVIEMISRMLQTEYRSIQILKALDGDEAIQKARQYLPDLLILDLILGEVYGIDVLASLRAEPLTAQIAVIIVSAQNPDLEKPRGGYRFDVNRTEGFSIIEMLRFEKAILDLLPVRGLPQ